MKEEPSILDYLKSKIFFWKGIKIEIPKQTHEETGPAPETQVDFHAGIQPPSQGGEEMTRAKPDLAQSQPEFPPEQQKPMAQPELTVLPPEQQPAPPKEPVSPLERQLALLEQRIAQLEKGQQPGTGTQPGMPILQVSPQIREQQAQLKPTPASISFPWRIIVGLLLALLAQRNLEPPDRNITFALLLYAGTVLFVAWSFLSKEFQTAAPGEDTQKAMPYKFKVFSGLLTLPMMVISFLTFKGDMFTTFNVLFWILTLGYIFWALWLPAKEPWWKSTFNKIMGFLKNPTIHFRISAWLVLMIVAVVAAMFFRLYWLDKVPGEMFSDHAEKLLDVSDVLSGKTSIFFPRNTGREAIQMYLTAVIAIVLKTGLSFISLKIGTALAGLLTLPYMYLLGKEIGNRWVGLLAFALTAIGYWPNLVARIGLRFPLYPLFVAPTLYYLIRGLRTQNRNYFMLSGLALGLGVHGYSPFRFVPVVVVAAVALYLVHRQSKGKRYQTVFGLVILAFVSVAVFLPLMRYMLDNPEMFNYRLLTRVGTTEQQYPAPVWQIFFDNFWKAEIMPFYDNGGIWVHSVTGRPSLDVVTAALYFIGTVLLIIRYLRRRHWLDLFLIVSVPLLMMPSILSLAFPDENPSLNRTGGAIIPVFLIAAIALEGTLSGSLTKMKSRWGIPLAVILTTILFLFSVSQNFNLVFVKYNDQFMRGAWNTDDIGQVIRGFADSVGDPDTAYVVPFPYWVDTRLVGMNAGYPLKDYALTSEHFADTLSETRTKLFILKAEDQNDLQLLQQMYPNGIVQLHTSRYEGKDFLVFLVPAVK